MKKIFFLAVMFFTGALLTYGQTDVTTFLDIPVDGTKPAMISKLRAKGYVYHSTGDYLTGQFNGRKVKVGIATNNNKVWRIMVKDDAGSSESDIKIRYNNLCAQFLEKGKYLPISSDEDYELTDKEDISYEMLVHNKRYEASFLQLPAQLDTIALQQEFSPIMQAKFTQEQLATPSEYVQEQIYKEVRNFYFKKFKHRVVWLMISEEFGEYYILLYYDNHKNEANGDDL